MKVARRISLALVSALALAALAAPAAPAATVGPAELVTDFSPARDSSTDGGRFHATAVNPTTGDQIVVYYAEDGDSPYLGAQVFDDQGPVGSEQVVATTGPDSYFSYSDALISELRRNGGGKIRVKAKQVGGGSKTITVTVPAPVTG